MKFVSLKKAKHLGVKEISICGKPFHVATYLGAVITKLFSNEEEAIRAARYTMEALQHEPILGIAGFDSELELKAKDKICFWQVVKLDRYERALVIGAHSGAFGDVYHYDCRAVAFDDRLLEHDMTVMQVLGLFSQSYEQEVV